MKSLTLFILLFLSFPFIGDTQVCQQHIISTVPATTFSTWEYQDCETGEILTHSLPCCGWTLPFCAIVGSVQLVEGDGFNAVLVNEVDGPWESCIPYNNPPCDEDLNGDGVVTVQDLLIALANYTPGTGEYSGIVANFGNPCE